MFLFACPFEQDWRSGQSVGDDGGVERGVVGAVMTVAAGARDMFDTYGVRLETQ